MREGYPVDFYLNIKEAFMKYLFKDAEKQYKVKISDLIQANVDLRQVFPIGYFAHYYKDEYYFNDRLNNIEKQKILITHNYEIIDIYPNLLDELNSTINEFLNLIQDKKPIEIYFNQALLLCETIDDINALFPKNICTAMPYSKFWEGIPNILPEIDLTLTINDIENHKKEFKELRGRMSARIVMNQLFNTI